MTSAWWYLDDNQLEPILTGLLDGAGWWLGLTVGFGAGALHAIGPGHGKTLIAAYLAGTRGRPVHAAGIGALVALMHTGVILVLSLATLALPLNLVDGQAERWFRGTSAVAIIAVGMWMLRRSHGTQSIRQAGAVEHATVAHTPPRAHALTQTASDHDHRHDLPARVDPLSRRGIAAIASSGGLVPSPAALLALVSAMALGRPTYGVALVTAFGVGLAATLTGFGLLIVWARERLVKVRRVPSARNISLLRRLPALVVIVGGGLLLLAAAAP